jgi:hypothetical protein
LIGIKVSFSKSITSYTTNTSTTELFLPSYADYDSQDLEHRPDPVEEIVLTDEEAAAIMPR